MKFADKAIPALVLLLTINLFNYIDRYILSSTIAGIESDLLQNAPAGSKKTWLGLLATCFMVSFMVFAPVFGWLALKIKRWHMIGFAILFWSLASGLSGVSGSMAQWNAKTFGNQVPWVYALIGSYGFLVLTRCMVGIGEAAYGPTAPTILSDHFPEKSRGWIMSIFYAAIPVGSALGYTFGGIAGWPNAFYWVIPPGLLLGLACFFMKEPQVGQKDEVKADTPSMPVSYLIRTPSYIFNCLGMIASTFAIGGIAYWFPYYVSVFRQAGTEKEAGTWMGLIIVSAGLLATLLGGMAGDYFKKYHSGSYFLVSGISMLVGFPLFLSVIYAPFPLAWFLIFLACFCLFFNTGPTNAILLNVAPPKLRTVSFAINIFMIHAFGDAISPWVIGGIADAFPVKQMQVVNGMAQEVHIGNLDAGFYAVSGMVLLSGLLWIAGAPFLEKDTRRASGTVNA